MTNIITQENKKEIIKLYSLGLNRLEVAKRANVPEWSVRKVLKGKFRTNSEWKDFVSAKKEDFLTEEQRQCFLGTLLGDASLIYRRKTFDYEVSHCLEQKEYLEHICYLLNRNVREYIKDKNSYSAGKLYYSTSYGNKATLTKIANIVCVNNKKKVNEKWMKELTALGIAYWFMDDGSSSFYRNSVKVVLATLSFSIDELNLLVDKLKEFGIKATIVKHSKRLGDKTQQYELSIKTKSINDFFDLVEPYIIPCMKYKVKRI